MIYEELQVRVVYNSFTFPVLSDGKMMDSLRKTEENNMNFEEIIEKIED